MAAGAGLSDEVVIVGRRGGLPVLALIGFGLTVGLASKLYLSTDVVFWLPLAIAALGLLFFLPMGLLSWFRPLRLRLGAAGFRIEPVLGPAKAVAWADVDGFRAWAPSIPFPGYGRQWVGWSWRDDARRHPRLSLRTRDGVVGAVPGEWTLSVEEIVALMNARLEASRA